MTKLITLISDVVQDVEHPLIRTSLQSAFDQSLAKLEAIENSFTTLATSVASSNNLNVFFHNWSMTNNSAIGLSGFCNRLTMRWRRETNGVSNAQTSTKYMNALSHLNRVTDEDLGATGGKLHYDLYYQMATMICQNDSWMSRQHLLPEGREFKQWKDRCMVKDKDLLMGFLVTLVHEVYTHGEVELILPVFDQWLRDTRSFNDKDRRRCLVWIDVHTKGTERNHFNETLQALPDLCSILDRNLEDYRLINIFSEYLSKKANVMVALKEQLDQNSQPIYLEAQA